MVEWPRWFSIETAARIIGTGPVTVMLIARTGQIRRKRSVVLLPRGCWNSDWLERAMKLCIGGW